MKKCAIIVSAYNADRFIEECYLSIAGQELFPGWEYEIRVGVDGCPKTAAKLASLAIPYYWSPINVGAYVIRNSLIGLAPADAFAIFDADDVMMPHYLRTLLPLLDLPSIAGAGRYTINLSGQILGQTPYTRGVFVISGEAFRLLGGFRDDRTSCDADLINRAELLSIPLFKIDLPLYYRRKHKDSLTQNKVTGFNSVYRNAIRTKHRQLMENGELYVIPTTTKLFPHLDNK